VEALRQVSQRLAQEYRFESSIELGAHRFSVRFTRA
jgi:hypothetical protein